MERVNRIVTVRPLPAYRLYVEFADGVSGEIDMSDRLFGPEFEPLKDWTAFSQVRIDEFGPICWPNGADLAPDAIYERLSEFRSTSPQAAK